VVSNTTYDGIQISGSSIPTFGITDTTNNAKFIAYVRDSDATIGMETNHPLTINTNNTERMRITSAGNVGIGTTSIANAKLKVSGGGVDIESSTDSLRLRFYEGAAFKSGIQQVLNIGEMITASAVGDMAIRANVGNMLFATGGSTERMRITSTGNVGIGTTSPTHLLTLETASSPSLKIKDTTQGATLLAFSQDANSHIGTYSPHPLVFDTNSSEKMRITSSGNVGIGTTSPIQKLHVNGASDGNSIYTAMLQNTGTAPGTASKLLFVQGGSTVRGAVVGGLQEATAGSPTSMVFETSAAYANPSERMRITSTGNVGIGETNPSSKLEVRAETATHKLVSLNRAASTTAAMYLGNDSSNNAIISSNYSDLIFGRDQSSTLSEWMRIKRDGNVGIGTTSPTNKLTVAAAQGTTFSDAFIGLKATSTIDTTGRTAISLATSPVNNFGVTLNGIRQGSSSGEPRFGIKMHNNSAGGLEALSIRASGNVGIGTTSPNAKLVVADGMLGSLSQTALEFIPQDSNNRNIIFSYDRSGGAYKELNFDASNFKFNPGGSTKVVIDTSGNVGIGTTSPDSTLTVKATVDNRLGGIGWKSTDGTNEWTIDAPNAGNFRIYKGSTAIARFDSSGNFGIGTTSPSQKLEVDGQVLSDGYRLAAMQTAPATRNSTGTLGEIVIDGNHIYVCYATDSWSRVALDTSW